GGEFSRQGPNPVGVEEDLFAAVVAEAVDGGVHLQRHDVVEPQEDRPLVACGVEMLPRVTHAVERLVELPRLLRCELSVVHPAPLDGVTYVHWYVHREPRRRRPDTGDPQGR